jgi:hypothetical protein
VARSTAPETAAISPGGGVNAPPARVTRPAIEDGARMPTGQAATGRGEKK